MRPLTALSAILSTLLIVASQECNKKYLDMVETVDDQSPSNKSFVCVCNAKKCDQPAELGETSTGKVILFRSSLAKDRYARSEVEFGKDFPEGVSKNEAVIKIEVSEWIKAQTISGFGGAFTDAAGIQLNSISNAAKDRLLDAYFGKNGSRYTFGRVPIASSDFSTHAYSYVEKDGDFNFTTFALTEEDYKMKIPHILTALNMSGGQLKLFASPWSAPAWMKQNNQMTYGGWLKGDLDGDYYKAYVNYYVKFFEEYAKNNLTFWGVTIQNEPGNTWKIQGMEFPPKYQRDFASDLLAPALQKIESGKNVLIIGHDNNRGGIFDAANQIYVDKDTPSVIAGLGTHIYVHDVPYSVLTRIHEFRPDKFLLSTESCTGDSDDHPHVMLGHWGRAEFYAMDIIMNLRNWVTGWVDWNLALDMEGGPNWAQNKVDAPIIVNNKTDEFYKQPMYYILGHFSRFVPPGSVKIDSQVTSGFDAGLMRFQCDNCPVQPIAFLTPDGDIALVILNRHNKKTYPISLNQGGKEAKFTVEPRSIVTAVWKANGVETLRASALLFLFMFVLVVM